MENVRDVVRRWGGKFKIIYHKNWENYMEEWQKKDGEIIHLTMYGTPIQEAITDIQNSRRDKLVVVGGSRVPTKVYKIADHNVSVTSQPHSEVSSLAVFLHMLFEGKELQLDFEDGEMKVIPTAKGKKVITQNK
ncbi:MAG: hypothetical protein Kow0019_15370 [Methanobacteriaceae archaeon]